MLHLAFIFHMHQPYYKDLLTNQAELPWVRLHGVKDYLDMALILKKIPAIHQTFNLVPSLIEQLQDYANRTVKDKFLELSSKPAKDLNAQEKNFILANFFSISKDKVISTFPRYFELYLKQQAKKEFSSQDFLDLQAWFNLSWIDPSFRKEMPELKQLIGKGRFFSEEEKQVILDKQIEILKGIIPAYKTLMQSGQIEVTISPYYHPILPLIFNVNVAREANPKAFLGKLEFSYPEDAKAQVEEAVKLYRERFGLAACGMWPSEEAVCEHILPLIIEAGINWIVADEAVLFRSLKKKRRDVKLLYQPYLLSREGGDLNIVFRDRNLSDLIGFSYSQMKSADAAADFIRHLENIAVSFKHQDVLVAVAMDGENAWEYFTNDGHDFLELLYARISESKIIKAVTVSEYLRAFPAQGKIKRLAAGSWIYGEFGKWIGNPYKLKAWEWLAAARKELEGIKVSGCQSINLELAWKQMYILEGSDWFWWYGEEPAGAFDRLFRAHLENFYKIISKESPAYLKYPLHP